jgi:hypothetical protein
MTYFFASELFTSACPGTQLPLSAAASDLACLRNFFTAIDRIGDWLLARGLAPLGLSVDVCPGYDGYVVSLVLSAEDLVDLAPLGREFWHVASESIPLRAEFHAWIESTGFELAQIVNWKSDGTCVVPLFPDHESVDHVFPSPSLWAHLISEQEASQLAEIERLKQQILAPHASLCAPEQESRTYGAE